ncbi:lysylphosphatidylglycerol synthase domain-containing protein [Mucilaginibacter myungsuensis]|uniref:lysylphosphatidylglycerol synthase domain-containing protein n=1 Tax=Mucilaginibacter myungsuensis TaxID=649104 RepID=UPI0025B31200|nr:lysylphosphatidylglycerol synthase domain-containing protein [Mucilaginibacter myungsuensis]MDN3601183.1 lysylphosphatidylglycerol synthase domain-containing protein [Mucilaginibacter myungsuensis]
MLNRSNKKILTYAIKAGILLLTAFYIYQKLSNRKDLVKFQQIISGMDRTLVISTMSVVVGLMLINWVLESGKWRYLTQRLQPMTLWESIEAVFCGLSWAILTPNRIGEYGGRVMFLSPRKRVHGVFAMAVGSFGQNVMTNVLGAAAFMWFVWTFLKLDPIFYFGLWILVFMFMLLMLLFYFNIRWMVSLLNSIKWLRKYHRFFDIMARYRFPELVRIMGYCIARYAVFSFQYYLVIHLLIPSIPVHDIFMMVFILFFIQSALPSLDLLDVGVRNITAGTLFAYVTDQKIAVMAAVTSIWFINLIVPAILGSIFVFKLKFFDNDV